MKQKSFSETVKSVFLTYPHAEAHPCKRYFVVGLDFNRIFNGKPLSI